MKVLKIHHNGIEIFSVDLNDQMEYIAGRDETCQIRLQDAAISRRHFRIFFDGVDWKIENISKFGKLLQGGLPVTLAALSPLSGFVVPPYQISLLEVAPSPSQEVAEPQLTTQTDSPHTPSAALPEKSASPSSSEESLDKTWVGPLQAATEAASAINIAGYLTITEMGQEDALWKLDRNPAGEDQWIVGRDAHCQIQVHGNGVSRKHFEIRQRNGEFFIADLKSTKGTLLNAVPLKVRTEYPLRSGDQIEFSESLALFELRDENFERGLSNLPVPFEAMGTTVQSMDLQMVGHQGREIELSNGLEEPADEANGVPYFMGPVPAQGGYPTAGFPDFPQGRAKKKNPTLIRVIIGLGALVLAGHQIFSGGGQKNADQSLQTKTLASKDPMASLTKEQREDLETSYRFADTLMKRNSYQAALREIEKIHELVASFKESKEMEAKCQRAIKAQRDRETVEADRKRIAETKRKVNEIVESCRRMSERSQSIPAVQSCLTPALELDPGNVIAQELVTRMEAARDAREKARQAVQALRHKVGSGEELYQRAVQLKGSGRLLLAVQAYESHLRSPYPDPKNLKEESKRQIASIKTDIQARVDSALKLAQEHFDNQKYKDSVRQLDRALDLDPDNEKAAELRSTITADLYKKMKVLYSDSVLEENLGRVEEAKEKWKQIVATDISSGEYYQKAKSKLSKYGDR